jgi:hypothetical protein
MCIVKIQINKELIGFEIKKQINFNSFFTKKKFKEKKQIIYFLYRNILYIIYNILLYIYIYI